jgi:hypothetical protein
MKSRSEYYREYYLKNRERILAKNRKWNKENAERVKEIRKLSDEKFEKKYGVPRSKVFSKLKQLSDEQTNS